MAENWIQNAVPKSHKGLFAAKAKRAGKSTAEYAREESHAGGKLGAEARFAENVAKVRPKSPMKKRYGK